MSHRVGPVLLIVVFALLTMGFVVALAQEPMRPNGILKPSSPEVKASPGSVAAHSAYTYTTVITVTSGTDPDTSKSTECSDVAADACTLRRAIVESRNLAGSQLPVLIRFNIPQDPSEGYDSSLQVWKIQVHTTTDLSIFRRLRRQTIIDGATQPNGRAHGPKIFIVGPTTGQKDGLIVGDIAGDDEIVIRGLGFQNLKNHIYLNTKNNLIEDNWFGLNDEGTAPYLRGDNPEDGSGSGGVAFSAGAMNNIVRNNVFLGFDGVAAAIRGDDNRFENNWVGTRADGTLDKQTDPSLICTPVDWLGGGRRIHGRRRPSDRGESVRRSAAGDLCQLYTAGRHQGHRR